MKIKKVSNLQDKKHFFNVVYKIYKNDKIWVPPLDVELKIIFSDKQNPFYTHGVACCWILLSDDDICVGRIAAFIDYKKKLSFEQPTGGIGFFECINNRDAAFLLFNTAKAWLENQNIEAIDAPINFGRNNRNCGLLIEGRENHTFGMNYQPDYYRIFFEDYGFKVYFKQYSFLFRLNDVIPERYWRIGAYVMNRPKYRFVHYNQKNQKKYIEDIVSIYNEANKFVTDFTSKTFNDIAQILREVKNSLNEKFIWIVYHGQKPIAFVIMYPDYNQVLKYINGKMSLINQLKIWWLKRYQKITRTRLSVLSILPEYEENGIEAALFCAIKKEMTKKKHYKEIEIAWVPDFNVKLIELYQLMGAKIHKIHHTYRYLINRNLEFKRYPIKEVNLKRP